MNYRYGSAWRGAGHSNGGKVGLMVEIHRKDQIGRGVQQLMSQHARGPEP